MGFPINNTPSIIFFDDDCLVCNGFIHFILQQDNGRGLFRFASLHSPEGEVWAQRAKIKIGNNKETMLMINQGEMFTQSTALLKILYRLGGIWLLSTPLLLLPAAIRNVFYNLFSKNRYRFGKEKSACRMVLPEHRKYFISQ